MTSPGAIVEGCKQREGKVSDQRLGQLVHGRGRLSRQAISTTIEKSTYTWTCINVKNRYCNIRHSLQSPKSSVELCREFLEVASGLDEQLAGRAEEAVGESSRCRWYFLQSLIFQISYWKKEQTNKIWNQFFFKSNIEWIVNSFFFTTGISEKILRTCQAFSAVSLRQRYLQLHPEAAEALEALEANAPTAAAQPAPPSVTATELTDDDTTVPDNTTQEAGEKNTEIWGKKQQLQCYSRSETGQKVVKLVKLFQCLDQNLLRKHPPNSRCSLTVCRMGWKWNGHCHPKRLQSRMVPDTWSQGLEFPLSEVVHVFSKMFEACNAYTQFTHSLHFVIISNFRIAWGASTTTCSCACPPPTATTATTATTAMLAATRSTPRMPRTTARPRKMATWRRPAGACDSLCIG